MILSKRERLIITVTLIVLALLGLDFYVVTPLLDRLAAIETQKQVLLDKMERGTALLANKRRIGPKWQEMTASGLKRGPAEAESQILHAVQNWSREAGLKLSSLKPERLPEKKNLQEISFQAGGTGSMSAVSRFLWCIETAKVPIRVKDLQLGARKEGTDDLTLQLRLSTLYQAVQPPAPAAEGAAVKKTGGSE